MTWLQMTVSLNKVFWLVWITSPEKGLLRPKKDTGPAFSYGVETIMCCAQAKKQRDGKQKDVSLFD